MSTQVSTRPARGPQRPPRTAHHQSNNKSVTDTDSDETRALRRKYSDKLATLKEVYPNWSDDDLLSLLAEVSGNVETAVVRITEGHAQQWGAVTRKKDKKLASSGGSGWDTASSTGRGDFSNQRGARGGRGGGLAGRGGRGGGRGGGPGRSFAGARSAQQPAATIPTNDVWGTAQPASDLAATSSSVWDAAPAADASGAATVDTKEDEPETAAFTDSNTTDATSVVPAESSAVAAVVPAAAAPTPAAPKSNSRIPTGTKLSWAQITKPKEVPKPAPPPAPPVVPSPAPPAPVSAPAPVSEPVEPTPVESTPTLSDNAPTGWEEPTTVQAPSWDDEPVTSVPQEPVTDASAATWQDPAIVSTSEAVPHQNVPEPISDTSTAPTESTAPTPSLTNATVTSTTSATTVEPSIISSSPPGLSAPSPAISQSPVTKPSLVKHTSAARNARFKSDQPVILPSSASQVAFGSGASPALSFGTTLDRFGMQFGSLSLGDEDSTEGPPPPEPTSEPQAPVAETLPAPTQQAPQQQSPVETQQSTAVAPAPAPVPAAQQLAQQAQQQHQNQQAQQQQEAQPQAPASLQSSTSLPAQLHQGHQYSPAYAANNSVGLGAAPSIPTQQHALSGTGYSALPHQQQQQHQAPQPHAYSHQPHHSLDRTTAHSSYYRGPEPQQSQPQQGTTYYSGSNSTQDLTASYSGEFSPLGMGLGGQAQSGALHQGIQAQGQQGGLAGLAGFGSSPAPVDYGLYGDQRGSYYDTYGQGSVFQGRNGSLGHNDLDKGLLSSQHQAPSGLPSSAPTQQPLGAPPGQQQQVGAAQQPPPAQTQPPYPGMAPMSHYYYPQPYTQTPYYGQYGAYPPQPQYMKYASPVYQQHAPGSSPAPQQQQLQQQAQNKPGLPPSGVAPSVASPYGSAQQVQQQSHLYGQQAGQPSYDEYSAQQHSAADPYGKQQPLYGQSLGNFLGSGSPAVPPAQTQQQQRGGASPESAYKPYNAQSGTANGASAADKTGAAGAQPRPQQPQVASGYFPTNRYGQQQQQQQQPGQQQQGTPGGRSYAPPEQAQAQYYQSYTPAYWQ